MNSTFLYIIQILDFPTKIWDTQKRTGQQSKICEASKAPLLYFLHPFNLPRIFTHAKKASMCALKCLRFFFKLKTCFVHIVQKDVWKKQKQKREGCVTWWWMKTCTAPLLLAVACKAHLEPKYQSCNTPISFDKWWLIGEPTR